MQIDFSRSMQHLDKRVHRNPYLIDVSKIWYLVVSQDTTPLYWHTVKLDQVKLGPWAPGIRLASNQMISELFLGASV